MKVIFLTLALVSASMAVNLKWFEATQYRVDPPNLVPLKHVLVLPKEPKSHEFPDYPKDVKPYNYPKYEEVKPYKYPNHEEIKPYKYPVYSSNPRSWDYPSGYQADPEYQQVDPYFWPGAWQSRRGYAPWHSDE